MCAGSPYKADRDLWLSPEARLLADAPGVEDFVYDGQGKRLVLPQDITVDEPLPLILIGSGKSLQLKNVKLVFASSLPACLQLGQGMCFKPETAEWKSHHKQQAQHTGARLPSKYNCLMTALRLGLKFCCPVTTTAQTHAGSDCSL